MDNANQEKITEEMWAEARENFDRVQEGLRGLRNHGGYGELLRNRPLLKRYKSGERSEKLYKQMINL